MSKTVDYFFDLGSPASYLAWTQLPALCSQHRARLFYHPMLLGGVFQATGNASPVAVPAKGRYMLADLQRFAARYGVPLVMPPGFPVNTLQLMRGLMGVQMKHPERFEEVMAVLFNGLWQQRRDLSEPAVLVQTLQGHGVEPGWFQDLAIQPDVKAALKVATEAAVARGVFGAPTCFVGEEMFFGQDRLDFVSEALA